MRTEEEIREALQREAATHRVDPVLRRSTVVRARLSRAVAVAGAAAVVAGVVFGGAGVVGALDRSDGGVAPGSRGEDAASRMVRGAPLLLLSEQGWRVSRADQQPAYGSGELTFTDGTRELDLNWRPADTHEEYLRDRQADAAGTWDVTLAGRDATLVQYEGTTDFTALWVDGDLSLELRGVFPEARDYMSVAATLERVDEETWLAALPDETVSPDERPAAVDAMLEDLPLHPDVDLDEVRSQPIVSDRYQLGARVTGAVACAWISQWVDATASNDTDSAHEAIDAMETSKRWAILVEMADEGGWSDVVWEYADAMAGKGKLTAGGPTTVEESYRDGLGCE